MDRFDSHSPSLTAPATDGASVIPGPAPLPQVSRALWVGGGGALTVELAEGATVTLAGVPGGTLLALRVRAVPSTGTSATDIVALW